MDEPTSRRPLAKKYSQVLKALPFKARFRMHLRRLAGLALFLMLPFDLPDDDDWVFFPYYHWVLDDEQDDFDRQLKYFARFGQFISIDDAVDAMQNPAGIGGRYFCVTFDDGFKNNLTNALPVLMNNNCPATFYVTTDYIGLDHSRDNERIQGFYDLSRTYPLPFEFLDWDDCRILHAAGMTIGSHTCGHYPLMNLSAEQIEHEMRDSKLRIESELKAPCLHFCCPWGVPGVTFDPATVSAAASRIGYRSCATTTYGFNHSGDDPMSLHRRCLEASDGNSIIRFALWQCRKQSC
jgi:peptidoglycan/xylan/chitin deacetylase (PgdA/CDA1 family)